MVDIEESVLDEMAKLIDGTKMSPAFNNFVKRARAKIFGKMLREGAFDFPMTNEELESAGS